MIKCFHETKIDFDFPLLPKWPGLVIVGDAVTEEQASIINVQTTSLHWDSNDREFERMLNTSLGLGERPRYPDPEQRFLDFFERINDISTELGILRLNYLKNENVLSSYIGGPHGWCDWKGNIGCCSYNVGKWPTGEDVYEEFRLIAEAFPFLTMKAQLLSEECCLALENNAVPLIEYRVSQGICNVMKPTKPLLKNDLIEEMSYKKLTVRGISFLERGCTLEQYVNAVNLTKKSLKKHD